MSAVKRPSFRSSYDSRVFGYSSTPIVFHTFYDCIAIMSQFGQERTLLFVGEQPDTFVWYYEILQHAYASLTDKAWADIKKELLTDHAFM